MTEKCGEVVIRDAVLTDVERIREIYDHYVRYTAISFEYETPTREEMRERMHRTMARFPYLVAERDGVVQGYAYAGPFKERAAYDWCCELSIYLAQDARKCGMGRRLYAAMEERLRDMGVLNLYACITCPDREDEYVTRNSMEFHSHLGFRQVAEFRREEGRLLPENLDYNAIGGLRLEARQKLSEIRPLSLGQAGRISGVSPADLAVLMIWLEQNGC